MTQQKTFREKVKKEIINSIKFNMMMLPRSKKDGSNWTQDELIELVVKGLLDQLTTLAYERAVKCLPKKKKQVTALPIGGDIDFGYVREIDGYNQAIDDMKQQLKKEFGA